MTELDTVKIKAEHPKNWCCIRCDTDWPCDTYLLAEALETERAKVARLSRLLDIGDVEDERTEAKLRAALADQPAPDPYLRSQDA